MLINYGMYQVEVVTNKNKVTKLANLFLCFSVLFGLQVIKPTLFMETYRLFFNFDPHLYSNWELYKMVWSNIQAGSMAAKVILPLLIAETIWLLVPIGLYKVLSRKNSSGECNLEHEYNQFDQSTIFDPAKSRASHIIEVQQIESGEKFGEFLLNHNIKLEILSVELHYGQLIKLTQYEYTAYARTTNLSLDRHQRFWDNGEKQDLPKQPTWNIEIAFIGNTCGMYTNVLNAVMEMNSYYRAKHIHDIKVRPYQHLNSLFEHSHSLRLPGNKKLVSIAYHGNELEIETEHEYEDTAGRWIRTTTIWLSDSGLICSESKGINEDYTVSTPDVTLTYVELPFENNRLKYIEIKQGEQPDIPPTTLILTVENTNESHPKKELQQLEIDLSASIASIKLASNETNKVLSISQYRTQQCCFQCRYESTGDRRR